MANRQITLRQGSSKVLDLFPHVLEFGLRKNNNIQLHSFVSSRCDNLLLYFILDGKFEWLIDREHHVLYPGDTALVLPGKEIGGSKGYLGIGSFFYLQLKVENCGSNGAVNFGEWSGLTESESIALGKILMMNLIPVVKAKEVGTMLHDLRVEIQGQEIGYVTRVNNMLDTLLIIIARQSTQNASSRRDFPHAFLKLEQSLRQDLSRQWTVEEMAAMVCLGTTAFTEKVKSYTGFAPLHYLINIRISEAIRMLKRPAVNVTDIALDTGFYSSQHFSTTFKKLTGQTPGEFRKSNYSRQAV